MKSIQVSDEWLYRHMPTLEEKLLNAMPEESEIKCEFSERFQKKMKILLKRAEQKEKYRIPVTTWRRTVASIAVVLSGILMASLGVEAIRTEIYEFIQQRFEIFTRTEYQIIKTETEEFVPLYPTYIPEGYDMDVEDVDSGYLFLKYQNSSGKEFMILQKQVKDKDVMYGDNEYISQRNVEVLGRKAILGKKEDGTIHILWKTESSLFQVAADVLSEEELIKISNSLRE